MGIGKSCGVPDNLRSTKYITLLEIKAPMMIQKLKEKIITSKDPIMLMIIRAKEATGNPKMTAPFLMFL